MCKVLFYNYNMVTSSVFFLSGFFPVVINFLRRVPIIGNVLNFPGISQVCNVILCNSWQEAVSMPNNKIRNKTGPLFLEFNWCKKRNPLGNWVIFNFQRTKTLYRNNLNSIAFFFTLFKAYRRNKLSVITAKTISHGSSRKQMSHFLRIVKHR